MTKSLKDNYFNNARGGSGGGEGEDEKITINKYNNLYYIYVCIILLIIIILYRFPKNKIVMSFLVIFIFIGIIFLIFGKRNEKGELFIGNIKFDELILFLNTNISSTTIFFIIFLVLFISILFYFNNALLYYIIIFIIIIGLAIIFNIFHNIIIRSSKNTITKFITEFIFFIPCLFNDILLWILQQFKLTSYITYILLLIELILILSYFYLPSLFKKVFSNDGKLLLDNPYYINIGKEKVIATSKDLIVSNNINDLQNINHQNPFNKNYAFSMWINLNPQSIALNKEIDIFRYGNEMNDGIFKPKVSYMYDYDTKKDVFKIYFTNDPENKNNNFEIIHIPNQRWNNFVLNYVDGIRGELWVNGIMERIFTFNNSNLPTYSMTDQVVVGNTLFNGINGAICSIKYFTKSLEPQEIANIYNLGIITNTYPGK